jgi:hypothetical protein
MIRDDSGDNDSGPYKHILKQLRTNIFTCVGNVVNLNLIEVIIM